MQRYRMRDRSLPSFFIPFNLFWAIVTLTLSVHGFHRGDWVGILSGTVSSALCLGFMFLFSLNVFLAITLRRESNASPQTSDDAGGTGAV